MSDILNLRPLRLGIHFKQNGDPGQNNGKRGLRRDKGESAAHHVHRQLFGSEYTQILIRLIADAIPLVERITASVTVLLTP